MTEHPSTSNVNRTSENRTFHLMSCLGRGGFGEVYHARMTRGGFEAEVAVKLMRELDPRGQPAARLRDEARLLGLVRHRAIPKVYDLVMLEGHLALVTEFIDGADLDDCVRAFPTLGARAACQVLADVADALHAAWTAPVRKGEALHLVHRDLKPANIRIGRDGVPKLLDFGIAWTDAVTRAAETGIGNLVGSPQYMAPERFDVIEPTTASDVYSVAAILFECLTGQRLWKQQPFQALAALSLSRERFERAVHDRLRELPPGLDPGLRAMLDAGLSYEADQRPTAQQAAERLQHLAERLQGATLTRWCRDHVWREPAPVQAAWVGRTLTEGLAGVTVPPSGGSRPMASTEPAPLPGVTPQPNRTPNRSGAPNTMEIEPDPTSSFAPDGVEDGASPTHDITWLTNTAGHAFADARDRTPWVLVGTAVVALVSPILFWTLPTPPPVDPAPPTSTEEAPQPSPTTAELPVAATPGPSPAPAASPAPPPPRSAAPPRAPAAPPAKATAPINVPTPETASPAPPRPEPVEPVLVSMGVEQGSAVWAPSLQGAAGTFALPANVPPGHYVILGEFTAGVAQIAGSVDVAEDTPQTIKCSALKNCKARP